ETMPRRKSLSEARMLLAVAAELPDTINLLGTKMMPKKPVTPLTRYSRPAILAVFLVEFIPSLLAHDSRLRYGPSSRRGIVVFPYEARRMDCFWIPWMYWPGQKPVRQLSSRTLRRGTMRRRGAA